MKKLLFISFLLIYSATSIAQNSYEYVIIPTKFPGISDGINPYGICSAINKTLGEKNIESVFETNEEPDDICDALTVNLIKTSNMFRNKLKVELLNCFGKVVWEAEGTGRSKEYDKGYAEAFADAVSELDELPVNETQMVRKSPVAVTKTNPEPEAKEMAMPATEADLPETPDKMGNEKETSGHQLANLFFNDQFFVNILDDENGGKKLKILNGKSLGYENIDIIATLAPSGLENVFTVSWLNSDGFKLNGVANLTADELKISLLDGDEKKVITLQKH